MFKVNQFNDDVTGSVIRQTHTNLGMLSTVMKTGDTVFFERMPGEDVQWIIPFKIFDEIGHDHTAMVIDSVVKLGGFGMEKI